MVEILKKLNIVQSRLNAPKGQVNSFGKYRFRSNEDILQAVKPLLEEVGAVIVQSDCMEMIGDRTYVVATSTIYDCETEQSLCNTAYARESLVKKGMDDSQVTGSTSSYARKYSLNGLLLIDDSKDADTMDNSNYQQQPEKEWLNDVSGVVSYAREQGLSGDEAVKIAMGKYKVSKDKQTEIRNGVASGELI